jgi:hypothetical protein
MLEPHHSQPFLPPSVSPRPAGENSEKGLLEGRKGPTTAQAKSRRFSLEQIAAAISWVLCRPFFGYGGGVLRLNLLFTVHFMRLARMCVQCYVQIKGCK